MEAPEKIFLYPYSTDGIYEVETKPLEGTVEYIRTDAFINKACEWFRRIDYDDSIPPFETTEEFIEGFKKSMKLYD